MSCTKIISPKRKYLEIGSLKYKIKIKSRTMTAPTNDIVSVSETFTTVKEVWSAISTNSGKEIFSDTSTIGVATHFFYVRYIANITSEYWIEYGGENYKILSIENLDENNEFLKISCSIRGTTTLDVNQA